DPLLDAAVLVAQRNRATHVPAVIAVGALVTVARFVRRASEDGLIPFGPEARRVVRMDRRQPSGAEALFERQSGQFRPVVVDVSDGSRLVTHPGDAGQRLDQPFEPPLAGADPIPHLPPLLP